MPKADKLALKDLDSIFFQVCRGKTCVQGTTAAAAAAVDGGGGVVLPSRKGKHMSHMHLDISNEIVRSQS